MHSQQNIDKWTSYHEGKNLSIALEENIYLSWKRSEARNIDYNKTLPKELALGEFERIKKAYKRLMVCSDWVINHFIENSQDDEAELMLFSRDGVLLRVYSKASGSGWLSQNGVKVGTKWSEENIGTNVFTLGIRRKQTYELSGELNYCRFLTEGYYYYSPIFLKDSELLGSIILAVPAAKTSHHFHSIVMSLVRTIELDMFLFKSIDIFINGDEDSGSIFIRQDKGKNEIVIINDQVFKILGLRKTDSHHLVLEDLIMPLPDNIEFWHIINEKRIVEDKSIGLLLKTGKVVVNITTSSYKENRFHSDGITLQFSNNGNMNKMNQRNTNNNAKYSFSDITSENERMLETIKRGQIAALSDSNILIQGESGVGKDVFAGAIHNSSRRSQKPFVAINCAAFSKELIASELFGYESGAFTGAKREGSIGKFEIANQGTLFLDEIGDMPMEVQSVLLRVLEEKSFRKVGGNKLIEVDVRIIAATNKNLKELIEQKLFREDLFYRLSIIRISIPPLKDRGADIFLFADDFIRKLCLKMDRPEVTLTKEARNALSKYPWPGNIRELQNLLEGIISTHEEQVITEKEIQSYLGDYFDKNPNTNAPEKTKSIAPHECNSQEIDDKETFILALKKFRNNKTKAAEYLGLSRSTFYRRMKEYELH